VLKDIDGYQRGRAVGEVAQVMRATLVAEGVPIDAIAFIPDEVQGARALLDWARADDLVILPIHGFKAREDLLALLATG